MEEQRWMEENKVRQGGPDVEANREVWQQQHKVLGLGDQENTNGQGELEKSNTESSFQSRRSSDTPLGDAHSTIDEFQSSQVTKEGKLSTSGSDILRAMKSGFGA